MNQVAPELQGLSMGQLGQRTLAQLLGMVQPWPAGTCLAGRHNRWLLTKFCQVDFSLIIFSLPPATLLPRLRMSVCVQLREKHLSQFHKNKCQPATELVGKFWWGQKLFKSCHRALFSDPVCVKRVDLLSYKLCAWAGGLVMTPVTLKQPQDCKKCYVKSCCLYLESCT